MSQFQNHIHILKGRDTMRHSQLRGDLLAMAGFR